jgi:hypothetical protein
MIVRIFNPATSQNEEHITPQEPLVQVARSDVEDKTFGKEVLRLLVQDDSGKIGRFSVSVKIKRGRPVAIVTAFLKEKDTSKRVTGVFKE